MLKSVKVAILGYGTVGGGVAQVIDANHDSILQKTGLDLEVRYILDLRDFPGDVNEHKVVHDIDVILKDPEVTVCCETMGGKRPAYDFSRRALEAGKSVCSSNKELVEAFGPELLQIASAHHCSYLFEASVGGGIPIIHNILNCLTQEKIGSVQGILNGTTNYMLTRMADEGADYETVLQEAQRLGYAEKNPEADVEGHDSGRKIAILASLVFGKTVKYDKIHVEGISSLTAADMAYARKLGCSVKLLGKASERVSRISAIVAPFLVKAGQPLYMVDDVFNAIVLHGNMLGDTMYYGAGAGRRPTASAVVSDIITAGLHEGSTAYCPWEPEEADLVPFEETENAFFVRIGTADQEQARNVFGAEKFITLPQMENECGFVTGRLKEGQFEEQFLALKHRISFIRMDA
ncbi:MAG: homoserine dehydrogenase [Lachnospiraceae bacterium]|nr:homoserine dehydrogenase [Lachnospiraceae bacterium]